MAASDFELALRLQKQFEQEESNAVSRVDRENSFEEIETSPTSNSRKRPYSEFDLDGTQQIVHPLWETLDPTPDIFGMFKGFNAKFFQGKLHCVELEWSKKMYSCAGICYQRRNRYGMACTIRLSEPLLKLRSRKNLVETLLHEMIHAYLFILNVREQNGGHGPNFKRIMTNINKAAGTNITVYHTFLDEVNFYKTHIWRCNGICQHRGPFFGFVRRTANRAPSANDQWWVQHHEQCGGTFLKVSEPDPVGKKRKGKTTATSTTKKTNATTNNNKIDDPRWGLVKKTTPTATAPKASTTNPRPGLVKRITPTATASRASTIVVRKPATTKPDPLRGQATADRSAGRSLSNVVGFKDLGTATNPSARTLSPSNGHALGTSGSLTDKSTARTGSSTSNPLANVRDIWSKKYLVETTQDRKSDTMADTKPTCLLTPVQSNWVQIDDDIEMENVIHETVTILDDSVPVVDDSPAAIVRQSSDEASIKREIMSSFGEDLTDSDIELIDHDYDTEAAPVEGLCDRTITDNLFSWNKSTEDLNKIHMTDEENVGNCDKELVSCPVCNIKCERELMADHLDGCFGMTRKIDPRRAVKPPIRGASKNNKPKRTPTSTVTSPTAEEEEFDRRILSEMEAEARSSRTSTVAVDNDEWTPCPVCTNSVKVSEINDHLDFCLS